jgi:hypothetical protein
MQEKIPLIILAIFLLFGVFLLKGGITGMAVSESCCFPPNCAPENVCTSTAATLEQPVLLLPQDNSALSGVGLLVIILSTALTFAYLKKHVNKLKQEENKQH